MLIGQNWSTWRSLSTMAAMESTKATLGILIFSPPFGPRRGKTLCDGAKIDRHAVALRLLREGIRRGLVSEQSRHGFPQNVWAVTDDGIVLEAQSENRVTGTYHGYPMQKANPFREKVLERWKAAGG
jgi:hypothetical protein